MGISLKPEHLKRYGQIARLLLRYGRTELVKEAGLEEALDEETVEAEVGAEAGEAPKAEELATDLEAMGPVRVRDVESAQRNIVAVIRRLEEAGEVVIRRGGGDDDLIA